MVIVDTTVWIDFLRGARNPEADYLDQQATIRSFGLLDVILCELLQGVPDEKSSTALLASLQAFEIFNSGGFEIATESARAYRTLRARGYTVRKLIDCWIASFCLLNGHTLLHRDRDFDPFEKYLDLRVIHP